MMLKLEEEIFLGPLNHYSVLSKGETVVVEVECANPFDMVKGWFR